MANGCSPSANKASPRRRSGLNSGLDIVEAIAGGGDRMTLTAIATVIGLSKPSVHRLLSTLVERGYVRRLPDQSYTIGIRAWQVGCVATPIAMARIAGPYMVELVQRVSDGAALAVLDGAQTVCIQLVESRRAVRVHDDIGNRCAAHCVSNGITLLSAMSDDEVMRLLPAELPPATDRSITDRATLLRTLAEARSKGHAVMQGAWREGVTGISVPVRGPDEHVVAALSLAMPDFHATQARLDAVLKELRRAANEIERAFGLDEGSAPARLAVQA